MRHGPRLFPRTYLAHPDGDASAPNPRASMMRRTFVLGATTIVGRSPCHFCTRAFSKAIRSGHGLARMAASQSLRRAPRVTAPWRHTSPPLGLSCMLWNLQESPVESDGPTCQMRSIVTRWRCASPPTSDHQAPCALNEGLSLSRPSTEVSPELHFKQPASLARGSAQVSCPYHLLPCLRSAQ